MLRHIVLVTFKPEATPDQIAAWHAAPWPAPEKWSCLK